MMTSLLRHGLGQAGVATDKRFKRAHVKPSRKRSAASRHAWFAIKLLIFVAVLGYAAYRGVTLLAAAPSLQIGHMVVRGHERLSTGEVLALVDGLRGQNILAVSLDDWQQKLLSSPWVEGATIRRVLPSTVEITVYERRPMGIGRIGTAMYLIDGNGVIVDEYGPAYADIDLPIIDGLAASPQGRLAGRHRARRVCRPASSARCRCVPRSRERCRSSTCPTCTMRSPCWTATPVLLRLGESDFVARLQQYLDLAPALRERVRGIDYVDLRFDERLYVRPAKDAVGGEEVNWEDCLARQERYVVGLDIGTTKVCTVVGELLDDGGVDVIGIGVAESKGLKRGVVVNLEAAVESIKKSIEEAELMAGVEVGSVHLAISGPHIKGFNSRGVVAVAGKNREVTRDDVRRAIDAARAVSLPAGREILHVLPQDFVVDEQEGIGAPVGLTGARLEVNVHIITGSQTATQNLVACVNRAGVEVMDTVIGQLAASETVLTADEKELGVAVIDIGGGTADLAIFERGSLWHTAVIAVGGDHFTNDIAVGLRTPIPDAEKVKRRAGCALSSMVEEDETIEVASVGGRRPRVMARRILSDILQPRAEEMFHLIWDEISKAGYEKSLNSGLVLTGGGAQLEGMSEIAEQIFDLPIRRGTPVGVGGLADHVEQPGLCHRRGAGDVRFASSRRRPRPAPEAAP